MRTIKMSSKFMEGATTIKECKQSEVYKIRVKLNSHKKLTREEMNFITRMVDKCENFAKAVCVGCWKFDFSDILQAFNVRGKDGLWRVKYATDTVALLKCMGSNAQCVMPIN